MTEETTTGAGGQGEGNGSKAPQFAKAGDAIKLIPKIRALLWTKCFITFTTLIKLTVLCRMQRLCQNALPNTTKARSRRNVDSLIASLVNLALTGRRL